MGYTQRKLIAKIVLTTFMSVFSISMLIPFAWMISASLQTRQPGVQCPYRLDPEGADLGELRKSVGIHRAVL